MTVIAVAALGQVSTAKSAQLPPSSLLIAPHIQGQTFCPEAVEDLKIISEEDAAAFCAAKGSNAAARISATLDAIGPAVSPSGKYALGYLLSFPLMRYFVQQNGAWVIDKKALQNDVSLIRDVNRPVVVYLSANHFTNAGIEISKQLAADPQNLMWTRKGPLRSDAYFAVPVYAWTLANDRAPVTVMRRAVFSAAIDAICKLDARSRDRIAAVSLLGEVHQLSPEFPNGMGYGESFEVTDYSPVSVQGFRAWLAARYRRVETLNSAEGTHFPSFDVIKPPSRNVLKDGGDATTHIDASAAGTLAIYGWTYDPAGGVLQIDLYIDGRKVGSTPSDLNRTDVPEADKTVKTPNVGWRFNYDFRTLRPGRHLLELTAASQNGKLARFGYRPFTVYGMKGGSVPDLTPGLPVPPGVQTTEGLRLLIDGPADGQHILYNGMAKLWLEYRNLQVRHYYEQFATLAERSCIPKDKVFSHEITPQLAATWDDELMAVSAAQRPDSLYSPGSTLYGGSAFGQAFFRLKASEGWKTYGVPELHPTFDLDVQQMETMLERHRMEGARFVAPYYLYTVPLRIPPVESKLYEWRISKDNPNYGSANFYNAISDLMRNR